MLIDAIFALLILLACVNGIRKGLILSLFSIIGFVVGLAAALKLSAVVAAKLSASINVSERWLPLIAFIVVFLVVVIIISFAGRLIQKTFEFAMLGWLNKLAGMILYILLYSIVYSVFLFYLVQLHVIKDDTIAASRIYPYLKPLGPGVIDAIGNIIPLFKNIFHQLEEFFGDVSNKIKH